MEAALFVKISEMLREELDVHVNNKIFWTDSNLHLATFTAIFINVCSQLCSTNLWSHQYETKAFHWKQQHFCRCFLWLRFKDEKSNKEVVQWSIIYIVLVAKMWNQWSTCRRSRAEKQLIIVNTIQIQENLVLTKLQERISSRTKMKRVVTLILVIKDNC